MVHGLVGVAVLDAFAGSGALGLEALSRGAGDALFVERDRRSVVALERNIAELGLDGVARVLVGDVKKLAETGAIPAGAFSLLFLDPPYRIDRSEVRGVIEALASSGALAEGALIVWEHSTTDQPEWPERVEPVSERRYGSTTVSIGELGGVETG